MYKCSKNYVTIDINNYISRTLYSSYVPQGTVLGPLLFLSFIDDLPTRITSKLRLSVDDCLLYRTISPVHPYFYPSTTVSTQPNDRWTGLCIKLCPVVTISNTMSCHNHINNITSQANRVLGLIKRHLTGISQKLRQQATCMSRPTYNIGILSATHTSRRG